MNARLFLPLVLLALAVTGRAQTVLNVDFGAGPAPVETGFAAAGQTTHDFWNPYSHYRPKFSPGMAPVPDGRLDGLKFADGPDSRVSVAVANAPGVWGNSSGDAMFDTFMFAPNGSNIVVTVLGLEPGRYHFYLYGHADADATPEQNSIFTLRSGTNTVGSLAGRTGYHPVVSVGLQQAPAWQEGQNFVLFRDVTVEGGQPVVIEVAPGPGGIAVLNGLQIVSRGTAPPRLANLEPMAAAGGPTNILFREIRYEGKVSAGEARFAVTLEAESRSTNELAAPLFEGDLALLAPKLPVGWRIVNQGRQFRIIASVPGTHTLTFELLAKVQINEPWRSIALLGPQAAIATVSVTSTEKDAEVQLLSGTSVEPDRPGVGAPSTPTLVLRGALGADRQLALRWQSKTVEVAREALVGADTQVVAQVTPSTIRWTTELRLDVLQGRLPRVRIALPPEHALTQLKGDAVRDWQTAVDETVRVAGVPASVLTVEFVRPVEASATLTLVTEQPLAALPAAIRFNPPQPLGLQRESGTFGVTAEDVTVRVESADALRQVNTSGNEVAAFRFNTRPAALRAQLSRIEPFVTVASRVTARLEESRFTVHHALDVTVARSGIYHLDLTPEPGLVVADVKGDGIEEWKLTAGVIHVSFRERLLGQRRVEVQLERALTNTQTELRLLPLSVAGAERQTAFIGAASAAGISLKTVGTENVREIPVTALPDPRDELLAFRAETAGWSATLGAERLAARVVAEVFNLVTIGDGLVGGSATIRFGIINQGVQQFRVRLPAHWRNIEFTGPNIRRQDQQDGVWTFSLQDKAWGAYTLVITYDYSFDPKQATLDAAGAHPLDVEREIGTIAITAAPGLTLDTAKFIDPLRQIDPTELSANDRGLISRPVLLAGRYTGGDFPLSLTLERHEEVPVLDAVADRAQLTSVLTETGEMLTQASFLVKNNERQFQRFRLPAGATLWGVAVNGEPAKADRDGDDLLVSLPRAENRDQTFAVDLKYAQGFGGSGGWWPRRLELTAPATDVAGTYAEWELYVPPTKRASGFAGNMTVARGTTYGWRDGWEEFVRVYRGLWHEFGVAFLGLTGVVAFVFSLALWSRRHGWGGALQVLAVFCILGILGGMLLPALAKAKSRAQRISSVNNLKNIGLAARTFAVDNGGRLPTNLDELKDELGAGKITRDPATGERYTWVGAGKSEEDPFGILAFSPAHEKGREVLLADGSVQQVTESRFNEMLAEEAKSKAAAAGGTDPILARRSGLARNMDAPAKPATQAQLPAIAAVDGGRVAGESQPGDKTVGSVTAFGAVGITGLGAPAAQPTPAGAPPTVAGIRSLRIEVPKSGRMFHFTRVLNVNAGGKESSPPGIRVSLVSARAFAITRTVLQLVAFLAGLIVCRVQWRRAEPSTLWLAVGAALLLGATGSLFVAWGALHLVLIVCVPVILISLLAWAVWKLVRRASVPVSPEPLEGTAPAAAAAAVLVLVGCLGTDRAQAAAPNAAPTNLVSIVSASFTGAARERVAQFEATFEISSAGTNQAVTLFGKDVAVRDFSVTSGEARLWRDGENIGVLLPARGNASLRLTMLVKLGGDAAHRRLEFGMPPALASQLKLTLDEPDAEVEVPGAVSLRLASPAGGQTGTVVEAVLGAIDRVSLGWTPRLRRAADVAATVFAQQTALVSLGGAEMAVRSQFNFQIPQGEIRQLRFALPEGHRLLRVTGESIRAWNLAETNRSELVVELVRSVGSSYRLTLETERPLEALPATVPVLLPRVLEVKRETGQLAVRGADELGLSIETATGLERMDGPEFQRLLGEGQGKLLVEQREGSPSAAVSLVSAWRFLRPEFDLRVKAEALRPKLEAIARNHFTIGAEQLGLSARVEFTVSRAGVFELPLELPPGWRLDGVSSDAMQMWAEQTNAPVRRLNVALKQRTLGVVAVQLELSRSTANLPPSLELAGVRPMNVDKLNGFVSVTAEPGVGLKTARLAGLTEIPAGQLGDWPPRGAAGILAFKQLSGDAQSTGAWLLTVDTESLASWVRAEVATSVQTTETLLTGRSLIRYDIQNAPVKEFRLRVPDDWRNVEISAPGIRRRDTNAIAGGVEWRVEMQARVRGEFRLTVSWEQPRAGATNELAVRGLETIGTERESGTVAFTAPVQLQLTPRTASDELLRIDAGELPGWARALNSAERPAALSYRYLRPGWRLALEARRFDEAPVLPALVDSAKLRTVVADDGQLMTQMQLTVRNNGRQHLEVRLPEGAVVWSAFVDGQPVRPAKRGDALLLPLERTGANEPPIPVEVTYVGRGRFPRSGGRVELVSPQFDVPMKDTHWELFLPPDYEYSGFRGTMSFESAELVPVAQEFTLAEYSRQEAIKDTAQAAEAGEVLKQARSEIAGGNFDAGGKKLSQARSRTLRDESAKKELKEVELELNRAQQSNLINAQQNYLFENNSRFGGLGGGLADDRKQTPARADYDAEVAARQVDQLQRAQAVAVTRVQPLRVNLPTRGIRHAFAQVLQTEPNKPLTIRFHAKNEREMGWLAKAGLWSGGFVSLWAGMALAVQIRARRKSTEL